MKLAWAVCAGISGVLATQTVFAIRAPLRSAKNVPFKVTYPDSARMQVYSALEAGDCKFIKGVSVNEHSELHYRGNTDAMNDMLKQLANCPGCTVTVSFSASDAPRDWRVDYDCDSMHSGRR